MKVHVLILFLFIGIAAGGNARAADELILPGFGELGVTPGASSLVADQSRSLTPNAAEPTPLETVLQSIKQSLPGRALDARLVDRSGRQAYEIRWMGDNGKVSDITADAISGEIVDKR
ncbi:MAG: PepSY domain-containing protein [Geminicoccaceae bacterium]